MRMHESLWPSTMIRPITTPASYLFSDAFNTSLELQTSCLWIKLNFKKSCNARHDAKKQCNTERYKLILENWGALSLFAMLSCAQAGWFSCLCLRCSEFGTASPSLFMICQHLNPGLAVTGRALTFCHAQLRTSWMSFCCFKLFGAWHSSAQACSRFVNPWIQA